MTLDADEEFGNDLDVVEWAVWFGRKTKGKARDVARLALDQHPGLRFSERIAAAYHPPDGHNLGQGEWTEGHDGYVRAPLENRGEPDNREGDPAFNGAFDKW